jgi:hypothetical protein
VSRAGPFYSTVKQARAGATLQHLAYVTVESVLTVAAIARMLGEITLCAVSGHPRGLDWQRMASGDVVGKCRRCGATVAP